MLQPGSGQELFLSHFHALVHLDSDFENKLTSVVPSERRKGWQAATGFEGKDATLNSGGINGADSN
jgi:hypothetical protein